MKIAIVCSVIPPSKIPNGIGEFSVQLARALAGAGHEISLICSDADRGRTLTAADLPDGPGLRSYPYRSILKVRLGIPSRLQVIPTEVLKSCDIVVIMSMLQGASVFAALQCQAAGKPYVIYPHGALLPAALKQSTRKKEAYFSLLGKRILKKAVAVIATSEPEREAIVPYAGNTTVVAIAGGTAFPPLAGPNEAETLEKAWPKMKGRRVVSSLSRVSREKGLDLLVDAWPEVIREFPDALLCLAVIGDTTELKSQINRLEISDSVLVLENFGGPAKWSLFRRSDLVVVPSRSESFGLVIAEALSAGIPVVATQAAPWPLIEEWGCGRWVKTDASSLSSGIRGILGVDSAGRKKMSEHAVDLIRKKYSWDEIGYQLIDFLGKVAQEHVRK